MSTWLRNRSRRDFLKTAGAASAIAIPTFIPSGVLAGPGRSGAGGKIRVGLIGAGGRARWLSRAMSRENKRAEIVAAADCYLPQLDKLAKENGNASWTAYQKYEEMYDKEDIDAVIIATPGRRGARVFASVKAGWEAG